MIKQLSRVGDPEPIATAVTVADSFLARSKGLLGRNHLAQEHALWIKRCNSIHTFFMKFAIDAVFVDKKLKVVSIYQDLKPWRITRIHLKASSVFEFQAGTLAHLKTGMIKVGDQLTYSNNGGSNGR